MSECESSAIKKAYQQRMNALELWSWTILFECTLDFKEIKPVRSTGNQPRIFIGRTDAEAEAPILWPPDAKSWLTGKESEGEKDWRQKEKGAWRMRWLDSITNSMDMNLSKVREMVEDQGDWHAAVCGVTKIQMWLQTTITKLTSLSSWIEVYLSRFYYWPERWNKGIYSTSALLHFPLGIRTIHVSFMLLLLLKAIFQGTTLLYGYA